MELIAPALLLFRRDPTDDVHSQKYLIGSSCRPEELLAGPHTDFPDLLDPFPHAEYEKGELIVSTIINRKKLALKFDKT